MVNAGKDALVCDLAEQYGVLDWRVHSAMFIATLAAGLRPHARIWPILEAMERTDAARGFASGEDFDTARKRILKGR